MAEKFREMGVLFKGNRKMLLFSQFDLGAQYKIYVKHEDVWRYYISFVILGEAKAYYDRIYDGS